MPNSTSPPDLQGNLCERAQSSLAYPAAPGGTYAGASAALRVLHELASSSATSMDALALLHELQVHQVELELQAEELLHARAELEAVLARQMQRYDAMPVACLGLDAQAHILELNATAAQLLGSPAQALCGQRLDVFLAPASSLMLHDLLGQAQQNGSRPCCALALLGPNGTLHTLSASVSADPTGSGYLLVLSTLPDGPCSFAHKAQQLD